MTYLSGLNDDQILQTVIPNPLMAPQSENPMVQAVRDVASLAFYHKYAMDLISKFSSVEPQAVLVKNTSHECLATKFWYLADEKDAYQVYWDVVHRFKPTHVLLRGFAENYSSDPILECVVVSGMITSLWRWSLLVPYRDPCRTKTCRRLLEFWGYSERLYGRIPGL